MSEKPTYEELEQRVKELEKETEKQLRTDEEMEGIEKQYRQIVETMDEALGVTDRNYVFTHVNERFCRLLEYSQDEMTGHYLFEFIHPDYKDLMEDQIAKRRNGEEERFEIAWRTKNGNTKYTIGSPKDFFDEKGNFTGSFGILTDISDLKQAEEALRKSEERYRKVVEDQTEIICRFYPDNTYSMVNDVYARFVGKSKEELIGKKWSPDVHPDDLEMINAKLATISPSNPVVVMENRVLSGKGNIHWMQFVNRGFYDNDMNLKEIQSVGRDITARKQAEEALRQSEEKYRAIVEDQTELICRFKSDYTLTFVNKAYARNWGRTSDEMIGINFLTLIPENAHEAVKKHFSSFSPMKASKSQEHEVFSKTGDLRWQRWSNRAFFDGEGNIVEFQSVGRDITERKHAEEALRENEEKFKAIFEGSHDAINLTAENGKVIDCNRRSLELFGLDSKEDFKNRRPADFSPDLQADGRKSHEAAGRYIHDAIKSGAFKRFEWLHQRTNGEIFPTEVILTSYTLKGERVLQSSIRDITERKQAAEEREKLQNQFLQAQKMESVGRLAGGVAHDFNNMLGVIIGHSEVAMSQLAPAAPVHANLKEILQAAKRSADLTRQLLAFARRQTVVPQVLDLNDTIPGMLKMLRRLIGEDIDLEWMPGAGLWPVKIDPAQIDQILANLSVNARDAISGVGKITIETQNVTLDEAYCGEQAGFVPGDYVMLVVSDNGCGMEKETRENLFEPFFTTKEIGAGTGLGLATVYGIVKQNDGFINVDSEPGEGATFKIYFIPSHETVASNKDQDIEPSTKGTETVLFVEDEAQILHIGKTMLERYGYKVLAAPTPGEAIDIAEGHEGTIHLLITDVVMPQMNGKELVAQIETLNPLIKVLFISGYTANVIVKRGILEADVHFLQKPFSLNSLTNKVREVLDDAKGSTQE